MSNTWSELEISKLSESKRLSRHDAALICEAASKIAEMEDPLISEKIITRLVNGYPLTPLSGESSEWEKLAEIGDNDIYKNRRHWRLQSTVERATGKVLNYREIGHTMGVLKDGSNKDRDDNWACMANDIGLALKPITFPYYPSIGTYVIEATRLVKLGDVYCCYVNKIYYPKDVARKTEIVRKYFAWRPGYWAEEVDRSFWASTRRGRASWAAELKNSTLLKEGHKE